MSNYVTSIEVSDGSRRSTPFPCIYLKRLKEIVYFIRLALSHELASNVRMISPSSQILLHQFIDVLYLKINIHK